MVALARVRGLEVLSSEKWVQFLGEHNPKIPNVCGTLRHHFHDIVEMSGGAGRLLPIWHATTKEELLSHSPSLVDRVALNTGNLTIEEMAEQLAEVIHPGEES